MKKWKERKRQLEKKRSGQAALKKQFSRFAVFAAGIFLLTGGHMLSAESDTAKIYSFKVKTIEGKETQLSEFAGKVLLIVNVASKCGYTKQYKGLQELYEKYKDRGFTVLGFPANNFMFQEPGSNEEIKKFCSLKYNVTFPMFSKIDVVGKGADPLYRYLTEETRSKVSWNFNKFLVGGDGKVLAHFGSGVEPLSSELTQQVESALSRK